MITTLNCDFKKANQLLVIGFDGFRWDYTHMYSTTTLWDVARDGVHAPLGLIPAFTTKTFPNFWTIATGLYEESHGIVDNSFFDPKYNKSFSIFNHDAQKQTIWWGGEPIWSTVKKQGKTSGVFFWPGSDAGDQALRPDFWRRYDERISFEERIETVLNWLQFDKIDLAMLYFNQPDNAAHKYGVFNRMVCDTVEKLDMLLNRLFTEMKRRELLSTTNILIVSDHGMTDINFYNGTPLIYLSDYIDIRNDVIDIPQAAAVAAILPKPDKVTKIYESLKDANPHLKVYYKEDIPERYHYKHNSRIMPIIAVADEGYLIQRLINNFKSNLLKYPTTRRTRIKIGQHGYDNNLLSMRPLFFALGPNLKRNYESESFETVNLYTLMCHLLDIKPSPNNGSLEVVKDMLENKFYL
ncbi:ectonucleotide pyrophosphatase/phosphodiesterase family member 5-like protein [Dinothrombium tinctorium]|uniref:Ectonucleotide pyrophosphatase/phosphodiesterase family member 5-like protein n=1 Tax=Dinothrombium tinctorium TaxID=1965070 RepID=A0A3S4QMX0_9ACAR|nr:ectonucleotide pyrophosphatase/phosphodiesterase family member 5-like protein [Dinothrombium tinctorium]